MVWRDDAECAGLPVEWWFALSDETADPQDCLRAFRVCDVCPVRLDCLRFARGLVCSGVEVAGIFGGKQFGPIRHPGRRSSAGGHWAPTARPRVVWGGGEEPFEVRRRLMG